MCSISSRVPNGTCENENIPGIGQRKMCTCSTDMCNSANIICYKLSLFLLYYMLSKVLWPYLNEYLHLQQGI